MTASNFNRSLDLVLGHEGGFVNNPKDPGGATNRGVTLRNFRRYVKPKGSIDDLKRLTVAQAGTVYRRQYWDAVHGSELPSGLDYAMFDFGVNSGPSRAIKFVQRIVGATADGRIGPATMAAIDGWPKGAGDIAGTLCDRRLAWMKTIRHRKTKALLWPTFGRGWTTRVNAVKAVSASMATAAPGKTERVPLPSPATEKASSPVRANLLDMIKGLWAAFQNWRRK